MNANNFSSPIILALDFSDDQAVMNLISQLNPAMCRVKVGKELFTRFGPSLVEKIQHAGFEVFLDLKFHDIPNTVAGAIKSVMSLGVWMTTLHISGGRHMLEAANNAIDQYVGHKPLLIGVTILTSLQTQDLVELGFNNDVDSLVQTMTKLAADVGLDGVVCSALDLPLLVPTYQNQLQFVTPGIVLSAANETDQKRTMTPEKALDQGSDYLVIGRSITKSLNPIETLHTLYSSLADRSK